MRKTPQGGSKTCEVSFCCLFGGLFTGRSEANGGRGESTSPDRRLLLGKKRKCAQKGPCTVAL